jgi:hypothetical protein
VENKDKLKNLRTGRRDDVFQEENWYRKGRGTGKGGRYMLEMSDYFKQSFWHY